MFIGLGTVATVVTGALGPLIGLAFESRTPERTRGLVTARLGLITGYLGMSSAASIAPEARVGLVGRAALLVVIGSLMVGGILGSALRVEQVPGGDLLPALLIAPVAVGLIAWFG